MRAIDSTRLAVLENGANCRVLAVCRLKTEQGGNDLQIVLHTVMDLFQQHLFFFQRRLDQILCLLAVADVAQHDGKYLLASQVELRYRSFSRELCLVLAAAKNFSAFSHLS